MDISIETRNFILVNKHVYGPDTDSPEFYKELSNRIKDINQHILLGDYYNLVLNKILDFINYIHLNNPKSK